MRPSLNRHQLLTYFQDNITVLAIVVVILVLIALTGVSINNYLATKDETDTLQTEVEKLSSDSDNIRYNKTITQDNITDYIEVLTRLIPDKEDYFSIIYALETLSKETNFNIVKYTINLSKTTADSLSISVEGDGDRDQFLKFLESYNFDGGRLITSEKINITSQEVGQVKMDLNFYNRSKSGSSQLSADATGVGKLSKKDIDLLNQIKNKIAVQIQSSDISDQYKTKDNPF